MIVRVVVWWRFSGIAGGMVVAIMVRWSWWYSGMVIGMVDVVWWR